jgi:hypothetical protein
MSRAVIGMLVACGLLAGGTAARAGSLEEMRDAKLAEPWLKSAPWITDYDKARAEAKATGKPIFAYFTRSYAP